MEIKSNDVRMIQIVQVRVVLILIERLNQCNQLMQNISLAYCFCQNTVPLIFTISSEFRICFAEQMKNDKLNFTPKKLIFTTPKNYPQLSFERSIVFTTNTVIANASKVYMKFFFSIDYYIHCNNNKTCILMAITVHEQRETKKFYFQETQRDFHQVSTVS